MASLEVDSWAAVWEANREAEAFGEAGSVEEVYISPAFWPIFSIRFFPFTPPGTTLLLLTILLALFLCSPRGDR